MRIRRQISLMALACALATLSGCATVERAAAPDSADQALALLVQDRLGQDAVTRRNQFRVAADGGVVTVRGFVSNEPDRMRTLGVIRGTPGVADVVDQLRIYK